MDKKGLRIVKADLHVHTPASKCFKENVSAEQIVEAALSEGLDAIAITDHNSGAWIDKIKTAARGKLTIFPGVEISCVGGKNGCVHIIALFDTDKNTEAIHSFLGSLEMKSEDYGKEDTYTSLSPEQVIDKIAKRDGLAVLAHSNSTKGVLHDMIGKPRTKIVKNRNLHAAECTDYYNEDAAKKKKRVVDLLNGKDPQYARSLAVYQASDNLVADGDGHCLAGIGKRFTYFKMDSLSLEGLRQCFHDHTVRIVQMNDLESFVYPKIESMKVTGGFLKETDFYFNDGFNAIIGGKGVGKSLGIEFLRFVLNQQSNTSFIIEDANGKLKDKLGYNQTVSITVSTSDGTRYLIERTFDQQDSPATIKNLETEEIFEGRAEDIFPILAYSQLEIIDIAKNRNAQLDLIDKFLDARSYKAKLDEIKKTLSKNNREVADSLIAMTRQIDLQKDKADIERQLDAVEKDLEHKIFKKYKLMDKRNRLLNRLFQYPDILKAKLTEIKQELDDKHKIPGSQDGKVPCDEVNEARSICEEILEEPKSSIDEAIERIEEKAKGLIPISRGWESTSSEIRQRYEAFIKEKGTLRKLEEKRKCWDSKKRELEERLEEVKELADKNSELLRQRNELLDKLDGIALDFYKKRERAFQDIQTFSGEKLQLVLEHKKDRSGFKSELMGLKKGSNIREDDVQKIVDTLDPRKFVQLVLDRNWKDLSKLADIRDENARKLGNFLVSLDAFHEVLALQHTAYPADVPIIKFRKPEGEYAELDLLSVGQKCSALVIIALTEGMMPIVIDQPEDSLDIRSVHDDVVLKLRSGKGKRQFIFTTHNSNIAVAADADKYLVLQSDAEGASIMCEGAIDRDDVRNAVLAHLEGGPEPYELRRGKYNL